MAVHYRTRGFIVKKTNRGENNELLTVYTKDFGKLKILGKSVRKITSKLRSSIQLFCFSEIEFIHGKSHKILTDAIIINDCLVFKNDFGKIFVVRRIADILDELMIGEEKDEKAWLLIEDVLERLRTAKIGDPATKNLSQYFLRNLTAILGYSPIRQNEV